MKIKYHQTDASGLDIIKPLWEKQRDHHQSVSTYFSHSFENITFQHRSEELRKKSEDGKLDIYVAHDCDLDRDIGYIVSSIETDNTGEIDSIYIEDEYRGSGIGRVLMGHGLQWLRENNAMDIRIVVAHGNDSVLKFYQQFGFYPKSYVLLEK